MQLTMGCVSYHPCSNGPAIALDIFGNMYYQDCHLHRLNLYTPHREGRCWWFYYLDKLNVKYAKYYDSMEDKL